MVGGTGVDESVLGVEHEVLARLLLDAVPNCIDTTSKSVENSLDIPAHLHGDYPQLVLLVDPRQEGLVLVVEDSTTFGPVSLHSCHLQVLVARDEQEVVIHELLSDILSHAGQRIIGPSKIALQVSKSLLHQVFNIQPLVFGDSGGQTESINVPANPNPGGLNRGGGVDIALDLGCVHVGSMSSISRDAMVFLDQRIEHLGKILVRIPVPCVDSTMLVIKLNGAGDSFAEGESCGLGGDA